MVTIGAISLTSLVVCALFIQPFKQILERIGKRFINDRIVELSQSIGPVRPRCPGALLGVIRRLIARRGD